MASSPNRPLQTPRRNPSSRRGNTSPTRSNSTNWILWTLFGILLVAGISVVAWRLQYQANWQKTDDKIMALLESADKLIEANRDDEAEAVAKQGLGLLPGDDRCQKMIERINTKRQTIRERKVEASDAALAQADELAKTDIILAIETLEKIVADDSLTPEAQKTAQSRITSLKGGVCSLRLPKEWPANAVLTLDGTTQQVVNELVGGIVPGKRKLTITRYGFSTPPPLELDFRGVDPLPLPPITWKLVGAKVFVKSIPPGASVWRRKRMPHGAVAWWKMRWARTCCVIFPRSGIPSITGGMEMPRWILSWRDPANSGHSRSSRGAVAKPRDYPPSANVFPKPGRS